uniref:Uncharacterized protein n=1 Tax=Peronospora matthiolae TaxID=2874970 RepID=A0AAV1VL16_9STRA
MASWARPSKSQAMTAPFYLFPNGDAIPYCRTCGRVISSRKSTNTTTTSSSSSKVSKAETNSKAKSEVTYCSSRCRGNKPGRLDKEIEQVFVRFLQREAQMGGVSRNTKGDTRMLVPLHLVENKVFGEKEDPGNALGRCGDCTPMVIAGKDSSYEDEGDTIDIGKPHLKDGPVREVNDETLRLGRCRAADVGPNVQSNLNIYSSNNVSPLQTQSKDHRGVIGERGRSEKVEETDEMREKRAEGQRRAHKRELVRRAARRGVVFGFLVDGSEQRKKCEAVSQGKVVEPSFAKGDWSIRWRDD